MSKKKKRQHKEKQQKTPGITSTPPFIDAHWDKLIIIVLILIPLIYFFPFLYIATSKAFNGATILKNN